VEEFVTVDGGGGGCPDNDNDGVCANVDCNDNNPNLPATVGSACNDNNANTNNDVIQSDGCTCAGVPNGGGGVDCDNISFAYDGTNMTVSGLDSRPVSLLQIFNSSWAEVFKCAGNCNGTEVIPLANDTYFVKASLYTSSWSTVCNKEAFVNSSTNLVAQQDSEDFLFSAVKDGRAARLYWVTNTEYKNEYFEVERSLNNIDFEVVDEKESDNNYWNAHFNYSGKDVAPQVGTNYYRIKKTHQDGTVAYSEVRTLTFDEMVNNFTVFPNPAKDEFFIQLSDFVGESGTISIYNAFGQLMTERSEDEISEGALRFSTSNFESGLYVVVVRMADRKVLSKKVMVARE
jgi:hypothetical protein